jgi:hypothetical protein
LHRLVVHNRSAIDSAFELLYLTPLFTLLFPMAALVTRLVLPSDLWLVMEMARARMFALEATRDG